MRSVLLCLAVSSCIAGAPAHACFPSCADMRGEDSLPVWVDTPNQENQLGVILYHNGDRNDVPANVWVYDEFPTVEGVITIRQKFTWNKDCKPMGYWCPDEFEVVAVPDGYMAFPPSIIIDEGDHVTIRVIKWEGM